jgi:hypothetical protein
VSFYWLKTVIRALFLIKNVLITRFQAKRAYNRAFLSKKTKVYKQAIAENLQFPLFGRSGGGREERKQCLDRI